MNGPMGQNLCRCTEALSTWGPVRMTDLPSRPANRLRKPSWRDTRLLAGVLVVLLCTVAGSLVVAHADDRVPMYAASVALVPGQALDAGSLTRVDVQLGADTAGYLSAAEALPADDFVLREVRPGELVPRSALGSKDQVSVQPVTINVDATSALTLVRGSVVDIYVNPPKPGVTGSNDVLRPGPGTAQRLGRHPAERAFRLRGSRHRHGGHLGDGARRQGRGADRPRGRRLQGDRRPGPGSVDEAGLVTRQALIALHPDVENAIVQAAEESAMLTVVRRCADLADLLATASAGVGDLAFVSAGLRGLDRSAVADLRTHRVGVVGVTRAGDEAEERSLRQLGIDEVVRSDGEPADLDAAVQAVGDTSAALDDRVGGADQASDLRTARWARPTDQLSPAMVSQARWTGLSPTVRTGVPASTGRAGSSPSGGRSAHPAPRPSRSTSLPSWPPPASWCSSSMPTRGVPASPRHWP